MNNQQSSLNPGTFTSALRFTAGLDAALYGSTDTAVLRFTGTPTIEGTGLSQETSAANGTIITVSRPGLYSVQLRGGNSITGSALVVGTSVNVAAAGLTGTPAFGTSGMRDVTIVNGPDAGGNAGAVQQSTMVAVTAQDIADGIAAGADGALLRLHGAGGTIVQGTASLEVRRVSSLY